MALRVIQIGIGPIGLGVMARCLERNDIEVVSAVDPHPEKAGRTIRELIAGGESRLSDQALRRAESIVVAPSLDEALGRLDELPDTALHTTSSFLDTAQGQLMELIARRLNVVSTCEELSYPWWHHPKEAATIDDAARQHGVRVIGTGVNPGFAMDLLPLVLTAVSASVDAVTVHRVVDAGKRRGPLQRKVGAGISPEEFATKKATGRFGHVGLAESVAFLAGGLGWDLASIETELQPKIATAPHVTAQVQIEAGQVLGIDQTAIGRDAEGRERIRLHLEMYVGAPNPRDVVTIHGTPPLTFSVDGGIPGDSATLSAVINTLPQLGSLAPGLRTMMDLPAPRWYGPADR